jgi:predicted enzyme related to lactoylglutathione lyase
VGGYELGLTPTESAPVGPVTYFGVDNIEMAVSKAIENGASVEEQINDVGDGIFVATLKSPRGERFGLILNPNFKPKN